MKMSDRMAQVRHPRGFDYLRITLAVLVVAWHGIYLTGDQTLFWAVLNSPLRPIKFLILPMFFALSGFLVTGSLERSNSIAGFLTLRVIRLYPALAVEVLLSALFIGPALTIVPLSSYVIDHRFMIYFANIVGWIHYQLPGVFLHNPRPNVVNLSLWTVPFELECYVAIVLVSLLGLHRRPKVFAAIVVSAVLVFWIYYLALHGGVSVTTVTMPGRILVLGFLAGVAVYLLRDILPFNPATGAASCLLSVALISFPSTMVLAVLPSAYFTAWLGLQNPPKVPILMDGDYSYGMYLFAFPLQQVLMLFPSVRPPQLAIPLAIIISMSYAAISWHLVEKPVLSRKSVFVQRADALAARLRSRIGLRPAAT